MDFNQANSKTPSIKTLFGIVAGIAIMILVQQLFFSSPSLDKKMMNAASELNKSCPVMVDKVTRFDNVAAMPDHIFQFNYTLVNLKKEDINVEEVKKNIEPILINTVKTSPELKLFRDNKTTLKYYYRDMNGIFIFNIIITPDKYLN